MQRYFFELSYNGTDYFGWQRQPKDISVQQVIEDSLSKMHSNEEIKVVGCGRTDSGVHAKHFALHVELPTIADTDKMTFKLNRMLPESIVISKIYSVDSELHARFSAKARTYRYYIHTAKNPFMKNLSWHVPQELNIEEMNKAAKQLLGKKDFTSFSKLHTDVKTNICTVTKAEWVQEADGIYFEISSDRFLRNMVRATVGTLMDVGFGKIKAESITDILNAMNRQAASVSVPAHGLFLWKVDY
jgi:tRNA pseudouridine38-40 synthase